MEVREENGVYEMYVQFDDETVDVITLDWELGATCGLKEDVQGRHPSCYQRRLG